MKTMALVGLMAATLFLAGCGKSDLIEDDVFANPGGMWMPHQLADQADLLEDLGVDHPERIADIQSPPLGAIVWLGGCSASFVSDQGLIATNHHCAQGSLQFHSTPESNLIEDGFLARAFDEELPGETGKKVWVTREIVDVTGVIREDLERIADPLERHDIIEARTKALIAECEAAGDGTRCSVESFYEGEKFYLVKMQEIRDVRLVYAPPRGIGFFGGEVDNWHWPRHTGDFTFYRAYVAPDGSPAEYSPDNVPYRPRYWLRVADEPLKPRDFVMVAGYPGRTQRWQTAEEVLFDFEKLHPTMIDLLQQVVGVYTDLAAQGEELAIKVTPSRFGVVNYLQNIQLVQENIKSAGLIDEKFFQQAQLADWIADEPERAAQWGGVLEAIYEADQAHWEDWYADYLVDALVNYTRLLDAAHTIVRMAEERPKPDDQRDPAFQQRNWDRIAQSLRRMQVSYDPVIDRAILTFYLTRIAMLPDPQSGPIQFAVAAGPLDSPVEIEAFADSLFNQPLPLENPDTRVDLFRNADLESLHDSESPFIRLALRLRPLTKEIEDEDKVFEGIMAVLRPPYVRAVRAFSERPLASDANGTLRVTYGTVKGYRPLPTAPPYPPFTTLQGVIEKHTGADPFDAPDELLAAAVDVSPASPYFSELLGDIPVNFLSDCDITGGNSGSATLNGDGEWIGLVFDGNAESLASDWVYMPDITRAIHVDVRYILWIMQNVSHADNLLQELGVPINR